MTGKFRRFLYGRLYYSRWLTGGLRFFNLGIAPVDPDVEALAAISHEKRQAQVYLEAVKAFRRHRPDREPGRVLEVATGLGGGLLVLADRFPGAALLGFDYLHAAIRRSAQAGTDALLFQADAHAVPLPAASVDLAVSIESFHALRPADFLGEARRILAADGVLAIVDFRMMPSAALKTWLAAEAETAGLRLAEFLDLTARAVESSRSDHDRRRRLAARVPFPFRGLVNEMTAGDGSDLRRQLESGEKTYFLAVLMPAARPAP